MVGDADDPAILAVSERIAADAPRARLAILPGVGHMLNLEQPALFAELLTEFLADVATGGFDGEPTLVPASTGSDLEGSASAFSPSPAADPSDRADPTPR